MKSLISVTEEDNTPELKIVNPITLGATPDKKASELEQLSNNSQPYFEKLAGEIDANGLKTEVNRKVKAKILAKARRPSIRKEKPWFDVEHIRDSLRFRTRINVFEDIKKICKLLADKKLGFVKVDLAKMFKPKSFGWRFAAFDLRSPENHQIVEYYSSFDELIEVNETVAHQLYEKWREYSREEQKKRFAEVERDVAKSRKEFESAWNAKLKELGISQQEALDRWQSISKEIHG